MSIQPGMFVREAQTADAEHILVAMRGILAEPNVNIARLPEELNFTIEEEEKIIAEYAASENSVFLVAVADAHIVGSLDCRGGKIKANRHAVWLGISVVKEWRNKGVGSQLMTRAIDWARDTKVISRIELAVFDRNQTAIHLYEKFGFITEGRRRRAICRNGEYLDDLIMAKLL